MAVNAGNDLHYDHAYFSWQESIGRFGGAANLPKFDKFVRATDTVVDFGCGGGFLLANIRAAVKIGVELNPSARANADKLGIKTVSSLDQLSGQTVDVVISNHAMEHVDDPLSVLKEVMRVLKPGGRAVFVVPCEHIGQKWRADDINFHLFSWSPMNLGNLFVRAGFEILEVEPVMHKWPPKYLLIQRVFGWKAFHIMSRVYSHFARGWFQSRCVARKPGAL